MNLSKWRLVLFLFCTNAMAFGHNMESHTNEGVNVESSQITTNQNFPLEMDGSFNLIDHYGNPVSNETYKGKHMLVFFGYASCKNMCSISLSRIGKALTLLGPSVEKLAPLVITVDPERDTPEKLKSELADYHSELIGLTGQQNQIDMAYRAFNQTPSQVGDDWDGDPIISHSSYIYLMDQEGKFQTLFPPVLDPQSMAKIIQKYIDKASS